MAQFLQKYKAAQLFSVWSNDAENSALPSQEYMTVLNIRKQNSRCKL